MLIDQAVFSSGQTDRASGYQLLGRSPGIGEADARELAAWGPSHDSLRDAASTAVSFNFHPLPSGAFCIGRTVAAGAEYSGRGRRIYTQSLVIGPSAFSLFANNPFNVLRAAESAGALIAYDQVPAQLAPLRLDAVGTAVDRHLLADLATQFGPAEIGNLLASVLDCPQVAIRGAVDPVQVVAGLMNCLPVVCRAEFSFSTGLRASPQRPFRILAAGENTVERRRLILQLGLTVVDVSENAHAARSEPAAGWAGFVASALAGGKTALLAAELAQPLPALGRTGLDELGDRLRQKLRSDDGPSPSATPESSAAPEPSRDELPNAPPVESRASSQPAQRADGAHPRFQNAERSGAAARAGVLPARVSADQDAAAQELLERLDDVVFGAINGFADALAELAVLWPKAAQTLGPQLAEESREQYLRCALSIWTDYLGDSRNGADRAAAALDVVCLLFEGP